MVYLFTGMIIGGIIGAAIGGLGIAFKAAEKEISRLSKEAKNVYKQS